jgi:hypothetical protein
MFAQQSSPNKAKYNQDITQDPCQAGMSILYIMLDFPQYIAKAWIFLVLVSFYRYKSTSCDHFLDMAINFLSISLYNVVKVWHFSWL